MWGPIKTVAKCKLYFPNFTISQLVEVKQLRIIILLLLKGRVTTPSTSPLDPLLHLDLLTSLLRSLIGQL